MLALSVNVNAPLATPSAESIVLARLLLLFIVVPLVELAILLWLADITHWTYTVGLIVVTGAVGTFLARTQGFRVWTQIQGELATGRMPGKALADGAMILLAGGLLLTPGVLTDLLGLSLLLPPCRAFYQRIIMARMKVRVFGAADDPTRSHTWTPGGGMGNTFDDVEPPRQGDRIIDSYVIESSEDEPPKE